MQNQEPRADDQYQVGHLKSKVDLPNSEERWTPLLFDDGAGTSYQMPKDLIYGMPLNWQTSNIFQSGKENTNGEQQQNQRNMSDAISPPCPPPPNSPPVSLDDFKDKSEGANKVIA